MKNELLPEMPGINKRLLYVIHMKYGTNINRFCKFSGIVQQRLNRLFITDKRSDKYPTVPADILATVVELYDDVNIHWILTGKGDPFMTDKNKDYLIQIQRKTIEALKNRT